MSQKQGLWHILRRIIVVSFLFVIAVIMSLIMFGYLYSYYKSYVSTLITPSTVKHVVLSNGENISYQTWGKSTDQSIVLLHGTGANSYIWSETAEILKDNNYYVIAFDIPPFGWSDIPKDQDYRKEIQAKRLTEALQILSIQNPIIAGHSYSSRVATQIALNMSIKKLVLIAPVFEYEKTVPSKSSYLAELSILRDPLLSLFINNPLLAKKLLYSFMYNKQVDIETPLSFTILPFNKPRIDHAYGEWFQEMFIPKSEISDTESLTKLSAPLSIIWGDKDTIAPIANFDLIKKYQPTAELFTLIGVGHMPHLEDNKNFSKVLLAVLKM